MTSPPIQIQFPELDIKYWSFDSLIKLGSLSGVKIKRGMQTREKTVLNYARLMTEMELTSSFLDPIDFMNEKGVLIKQKVKYEWKSVIYNHCHMFAHDEQIQTPHHRNANFVNPDGFSIPRRTSNIRVHTSPNRKFPSPNAFFQALTEHDIIDLITHEVKTKVKLNNLAVVCQKVYGSKVISSHQFHQEGSIIVAWKPNAYNLEVLTRYMELSFSLATLILERFYALFRVQSAFYTWTNEHVWSRMDRDLVNLKWYNTSDFAQDEFFHICLLDYTPIVLEKGQPISIHLSIKKGIEFRDLMRPVLTVEHQLKLCKSFSDHDIKQSMFSISNEKSLCPNGFNTGFLRLFNLFKLLWTPSISSQLLQCTGFREGILQLRYLGVPITPHRLTKSDCKSLVEKIITKIKTWPSRHISYVGRVVLINVVPMREATSQSEVKEIHEDGTKGWRGCLDVARDSMLWLIRFREKEIKQCFKISNLCGSTQYIVLKSKILLLG
ncbi:hypothetical protein Cgig2_026263 [Carnegiea gigantea]|uniref:Uncharacterized protein n=1 Tax=Carnegiea gigantea TaxID=171969 RepID=A0A9Q1GYA7_9CARY|nr:hypothetical protein Cgig2_026263 [Carnegiea gigantea]